MPSTITVNALRIKQRQDIPIYVFGIEGRLVHQIASVSFAQRSKAGVLEGYQRGAAKTHIRDILNYLNDSAALLPNAIVMALDDRVAFAKVTDAVENDWGTHGKLTIPIPKNAMERKAGWIVDGQQRATALAQLDASRKLPVVVVAFQSASTKIQREQFVLVNKTKPLPRDLLHEILPAIDARLPKSLSMQRLAARVVEEVRFTPDSPFEGRVRGLGATGESHNISQAAVIAVVTESIRKKGVLLYHYDPSGRQHDYTAMARVLNVYFEGVRRVWPKAWDAAPQSSRLVHGVGIVALGHLMDRVMTEVDAGSVKAAHMVETRLARIAKSCAWTSGRWPVLDCEWNALQNTSQDKSRLSDYLLREYAKRGGA